MLRVYSVIYRIMIMLALLGSFAAKIMVGAAGHNSGTGISDDIFIAYCIVTIVTLTVNVNTKSGKLKHILKFVNVVLVLLGVFAAGYIVGTIFYEGDIFLQMTIPLILFIITGVQLIRALIKDKASL